MTRKHFVDLVNIIADNGLSRQAVQDIMRFCDKHNSRFDEEVFITALRKAGWDNWQGMV